jgi:flavin reductase (DIM6/NTAB) family NADH-FMN oxidoreductase RutF
MHSTEAGFRDLMSCFPTGVAVVTSLDEAGRPQGMTCSSLASVCLQPPTLLVCLRSDSCTCDAARRGGAFAVNLLAETGRHVAEGFASRPAGKRFTDVAWAASPAGLPWLTEHTAATADCTVTDAVAYGNHTVLIGRVDRLVVGQDGPLLYGLRQYVGWTGLSSDRR